MQITRGLIDDAQKVVIYGPEGIGKSTFASKFPDPVFIDTEGSTKRLDIARTNRPSSWVMLLEQVRYFRDTPGVCGTLVIDTADWAEQLCVDHICAKAQTDGLEGFGYGKGYIYLAEEFGRLLNLLEEVIARGIHVVIAAHAKMRKFEQPDEMGAYDRWEMKLQKGTAPLVKEWADMVLFARFKTYVVNVDNQGVQKGKNKAQGGTRAMCATHHPCWDAKNRHGLNDEMPFDYSAIAHCIISPATPAPVPQPPLAASSAATAGPPMTAADSGPVIQPEAAGAPEQTRLEPLKKAEQKYTGSFPPTPDQPIRAVPQLNPEIPKALRDLMETNLVTEREIQTAIAKRGYYSADTPITKYAPEFITGVLIGAWANVLKFIEEQVRDLPF